MNKIKDELVEMTEKFIDESKERRARAVSYARSFIKPKAPQPEPEPKRDYHFSEDARERMDQRRYQNQIEAENTLSEKQHAVLINYSHGLPLDADCIKVRGNTVCSLAAFATYSRET